MLTGRCPDNLALVLENLLGFEGVARRLVVQTALDPLICGILASL